MKAIIIDDEKEARETLSVHLRTYCPQVEIKGLAQNGWEGLALCKAQKPDLIFLDVEMPDLTGFEVMERLGHTTSSFVFVTGFNKYAEMAFEFCAVDFLRKPVEPSRLVQAVHRVSERHRLLHAQTQYQMLLELINQRHTLSNQGDQRIAFSTQTEVVFSWLRNIIHITADTSMSYVRLVEFPKPLYIAKNIGSYEQQFLDAEATFLMRVHRSHLVNLYHVKKFLREDSVLQMSDGQYISLSDGRKDLVLAGLDALGLNNRE